MEWFFFFVMAMLIVGGISYWMFPHKISLQEVGIISIFYLCIMSMVYFAGTYMNGRDVQILNGQVTQKKSEKVSCSHSYCCGWTTRCSGSGKTHSCYPVCNRTCYDHPYDVDWNIVASVGSLSIDRVDRQGVQEPPRWTEVKIGEPFAIEDSYYNYIKAAPFSVFNKSHLNNPVTIPSYMEVTDYYRINRVTSYGVDVGNTSVLNSKLNDYLRTIGPKRKVNVWVVFHNKGGNFAEILKAKSVGGKINDVTIAINTDKTGVFKNVAVFSWSKYDLVNVAIRDALLDIGKVDQEKMADAIMQNIDKHYKHRSIHEFEYLENETYISDTLFTWLVVLGILLPIAGAVAAWHFDSGTEEKKSRFNFPKWRK